MNLFIETPRQQAERLARGAGEACAEQPASGLFSGVREMPTQPQTQMPQKGEVRGSEFLAEASKKPRRLFKRRRAQRGMSGDFQAKAQPDTGSNVSTASSDTSASTARTFGLEQPISGHSEAAQANLASEPYSIAQESYAAELDYDRKRHRVRHRRAILRVLLVIVLVPVVLFAAFVAAYALTCALNGATPEEFLQLMSSLFDRMGTFASAITSQLKLPAL